MRWVTHFSLRALSIAYRDEKENKKIDLESGESVE
jgi:hypothetical protein